MDYARIRGRFPSLLNSLGIFKKILTGKYPRSIAAFNLRFQARNPKTINQKILHKMAFDKSPNQTIFADKYKVRDYVSERVGSKYLSKVLHVGNPGDLIPWETLPEEFVLKCNHSSGGSVIIWRGAEKAELPRQLNFYNWTKYLIHPEKIDKLKIQFFFNKLLKQNYADFPGFREFAYLDIPPRLIVEELLLDAAGRIPDDIKFWCINGRVELIQVDISRFSNHQRQILDRNWNRITATLAYPLIEQEISVPLNLQEMIKVAELLSAEVDFLRVDLYDLGSRIVFGELTNYPGGGLEIFKPKGVGLRLGALLKLDSSKISID